jgi:tetratricopeptide (TPR) repeat protein
MSSGGDGEKAAADFVLQCAETCYADASTAFEKAKDRVNAALVGLNRAQACRARAAWNLPRTVATSRLIEAEPDPRGRGRENDDRWRLGEFEAAAGHCRRALQSLQPAAGSERGSRRQRGIDRKGGNPPPAVVSAARSELGNAALAAGLELRRLGDVSGAITRMEEAVRVLQGAVDRSPAAVASLSAAHYHLGSLLADAALAREDGAGAGVGSFGSVSGVDGGNKFLPAQRHLERALAGFPPTTAPLDHARLRLRLAALADATGEGVVRGGGGGAAGVGHRESAVAHLLRAGAAFGSAPPGLDGERGWTEARKETEELLLAVLKNLVQCSVGGKRHGGHRELYSRALRGFGGSLRDFASGLGELEEAARLAHVIR